MEAKKLTKFKDLPVPAQKAIFYYMVMDSDYWPERSLARAIKAHGDEKFIYTEIPMDVLTEQMMHTLTTYEEGFPFSSFDEYHDWYMKTHAPVRSHPKTNLWPVILSPLDDETIQDGSHRLHDYYRKGVKKVPTIMFQP